MVPQGLPLQSSGGLGFKIYGLVGFLEASR